MKTADDLRRRLERIDGRGYKAYREIQDSYTLPEGLALHLDHIQGDPFAAPSRIRLVLLQSEALFPAALHRLPARRRALENYVSRAAACAAARFTRGRRGSGRSGALEIRHGAQEILERSAVSIDDKRLEARFTVGLPAAGRRVLGREAIEILLGELPRIARRSLRYRSLKVDRVEAHCNAAEDQEVLRAELSRRALVAFVADGALLPRRSGVDDRPLTDGAIPFRSPTSLRLKLELPHAGPVSGMGIPAGVTLIVGGGFHGKSTLLRALERSVYDHIPGDGREQVVTAASAVKIRAEDGRRVERVDISPFIGNLPLGRDTAAFSTDNASGSTSQAANIIEALEAGAELLLLDEDSCATNFMIRDERMQALVSKEKEPITPFLDKVRQLHADRGVSSILVMGGSGDYFETADLVLMMDNYRPREVTAEAREVASRLGSGRQAEGGERFGPLTHRRPDRRSFDSSRGRRPLKIDVRGLERIVYGTTTIDLSCLEQLVDPDQTRAIARIIHLYQAQYCGRGPHLRGELEALFGELELRGLDLISPFREGDLARPRIQEVMMAINRMRTLRVIE